MKLQIFICKTMNFETSCFPMPNNKNSIFKCSTNKYFIINLQNIGNKMDFQCPVFRRKVPCQTEEP